MKRCALLFIILFQICTAGIHQQIQMDTESGRISSTQALFYEALLIYAPDKLPLQYQEMEIQPIKCGFSVQARLQQSWHLLSEEQKNILAPSLSRLSLPFEYTSPSGLFLLHYADEGTNAVPSDDLDNNEVPDFIEEGGKALDLAYEVIINQMGYHEPPQDTKDGPEWDVYFQNDNDYGETILEEIVTSNPLTYRSYMNMNNDFQEVETPGIEGLRVTCAHEFFHMVQLGYQYRASDVFLMEASATWMEDVVYDEVNDYLNYLDDIFGQDNIPFDRQGLHQYGMSVWFHFLSRRYGDDIVKQIWEQIIPYPALQACDKALNQFGMNLTDEIAEFYGWNLITGSRADTIHFYPEGHLYPEQSISEKIELFDNQVFRRAVRKTGAYYIEASMLDESSIIWAMVNANWESSQSQGDGMLQIRTGSADSYYNMITDTVFSTLISDQGFGWRYDVLIQEPGQNATLNIYPEFNEMLFGTISGKVWTYHELDGVWTQIGGLSNVSIGCRSAGSDSLFDTEDDPVFADQQTGVDGHYEFFGLPDGHYRLDLDESSLSAPYVTVDGILSLEFSLENGNDIFNADFGVRRLEAHHLPASIPNPYVINEWPDMKIPFSLDGPDLVELTIFSSQGFLIYQVEKYFEIEDLAYFRWDGTVNNEPVPSGVYLYVIVSHNEVIRREKIAIIH
ncbi:MXAN_6640 family putative metalloprotease [bacterium]